MVWEILLFFYQNPCGIGDKAISKIKKEDNNMNGTIGKNIKQGTKVRVVQKQDQPSGKRYAPFDEGEVGHNTSLLCKNCRL